jgi:hypothetical protein
MGHSRREGLPDGHRTPGRYARPQLNVRRILGTFGERDLINSVLTPFASSARLSIPIKSFLYRQKITEYGICGRRRGFRPDFVAKLTVPGVRFFGGLSNERPENSGRRIAVGQCARARGTVAIMELCSRGRVHDRCLRSGEGDCHDSLSRPEIFASISIQQI